jgi:SAM-dependent methyltransferase
MRLEARDWARVHDGSEAAGWIFRRGVELCLAACTAHLVPGALWLDVGCGTGHLAAALARRGVRAVGCDRDPHMAAYAAARWSLPSFTADAAALALPDGACAGVTATSLLGYLPRPAAFFAEAARVLAPGGTLCLTAMNRASFLLRGARALGWRRRFTAGRFTAHHPAALVAALAAAGFVVERQIFYGHLLTAGRLAAPPRATARRLEHPAAPGAANRWARQILLLARRRAPSQPAGAPC